MQVKVKGTLMNERNGFYFLGNKNGRLLRLGGNIPTDAVGDDVELAGSLEWTDERTQSDEVPYLNVT